MRPAADYLRVGQVSRATGLSRETVRRRINAGEFGDFLFDVSAGYLVARRGLDLWLDSRRIRVADRRSRA